jgi:hypothetical protein
MSISEDVHICWSGLRVWAKLHNAGGQAGTMQLSVQQPCMCVVVCVCVCVCVRVRVRVCVL